MIYVEDPDTNTDESNPYSFTVFLAGGITGCPDWQADFIEYLRAEFDKDSPVDILVFNPRRKNFPIDDPTASEFQIKWEYDRLHKADFIIFWFPMETLCPIALYELGFWNAKGKPIVVGCHAGYQRLNDVYIQTKLANPDVQIVNDLCKLAKNLSAEIYKELF